MTSPAASATHIGRVDESAMLQAALARSLTGRPGGIVVSGEAGIGKTRLLTEFVATLGADVLVARGQCIDSGIAGTPFAPIRSVLRGIVDRAGTDAIRDAAGPGAAALGALIPGFAVGGDAADGSEQLHEAVSAVLTDVSAAQPLVVVIEDLHWADAATLSLLRSLLRTLQEGRVLVVLTYRTDDVGRGHPLRPVLAEMDRSRSVTRIELARLTAAEVAEQVTAITGARPDPVRMARILESSDGVPFFVEELLAVDTTPYGLPETLRDLVLARYETLSAPTQTMLRLLAAGGVSVEHSVLEAVFDGDDDALDAAAAEAVNANVIVTTATEYAFRHALTQEAVHDQLLPGEYTRFHARYGQVLAQRPDVSAAEVAHHLMLAHDLPAAFAATLRAVVEARDSQAYASAARLGERALQLWPQLAEADRIAGRDHIELLNQTAVDLIEVGDNSRAAALFAEALAELGEQDPRRRIGLLILLAAAVVDDQDRQRELTSEALSLVQGLIERAVGEPAPEDVSLLARNLGTMSVYHMNQAAFAESLDFADQALAAALRAGDHAQELRARTYRGQSRIMLGRVAEGLADWDDVTAASGDAVEPRLRLAMFVGAALVPLGLPRRAADETLAALALARAHNVEGSWGPWIADSAIEALASLGEWDRAVVEAQRAIRLWSHLRYTAPEQLTLLKVARILDDQERAARLLAQEESNIRRESELDPEYTLRAHALLAEFALDDADAARAWQEIWPVIDGERRPFAGYDTTVLPVAARALAALRRAGGAEPDGAEPRLRRHFDSCAIWDVSVRWRALFDAELGAAGEAGRDPLLWREAVAAVDDEAIPVHLRPYARLRLGEALLAQGARDDAHAALVDAQATAEAVGARLYARLARELAADAGMPLPTGAADPARAASMDHVLTPRELQVLALVAEGLTNPQIGERLFISPKTASVHVSAILGKIGAANRTEAAALYAAAGTPEAS